MIYRISFDIGKGIENRFMATLDDVASFTDGLVMMHASVRVYPVLYLMEGRRWEVVESPRFRQHRCYLCGELMY